MFKSFKNAIAKQFARMSKHKLYQTNTEKDALWTTYLGSFPEGTDPIHKQRTEHDCQCCRSFIRTVGNVVAIIDGKVETIWSIKVGGFYQVVADTMDALVKSSAITDIFLHIEPKAGQDKSYQKLELEKEIATWEHFFVMLPEATVVDKKEIGTKLNETRGVHDVMARSLAEITMNAIETFKELNSQGSVYRGEEQKFAIKGFEQLKRTFDKLPDGQPRDLFVWSNIGVEGSIAKIRNTAVGTLLLDLCDEDADLDIAMKKWNKVMAPENFKQPKTAATPKQIEAAKETIVGLGLMTAMPRRYATLSDITIANIIHANRSSKAAMMDMNVFDELITAVPEKVKSYDKVEEVAIEKFIAEILPNSAMIEIMFENRHTSNLVSLIAPQDPTAGQLFKWPSNFSWAYNGDLADSDIRQAVQARGGRVDGVFRFSHSWNHDKRNASLMDLHVFMPGNETTAANGTHDKYGNHERVGWNWRNHGYSGGTQDVDYTTAAPVGYIPVENIAFPTLDKMKDGVYICKVHNWQLRQPTQGGFRAEIEFGGELFQYEYDKPMANKEWVTVAEVTLKNGAFTIKHHLPESASVKKEWGIQTQAFHKVNVAMYSPNHWDDARGYGNRHYFFMLDGCIQEGSARGFLNEYLRADLDPHKKAFQMVGAKMKTPESTDQLSGLGFSDTQRNGFLCRITGNSGLKRVIKVKV